MKSLFGGAAFGRHCMSIVGMMLALGFGAQKADAATYKFTAAQLNAQNCGVWPSCYRGSMSFNYDTTSGQFSEISWNLGYNDSRGQRLENIVTSGQPTKVSSAVGVTYTQSRVIALTGTYFTPDWLFYSDTAPAITYPGTNYVTEISGASTFVNALGLDIDLAAVIAGTTNDVTAIYIDPRSLNSHAFGGTVQASLVPDVGNPAPVPLPAGAMLILTGVAAFGATARPKSRNR